MQVSKEIIEVLDYLCKKIGVTIDWTNKNVLPYLETLCKKFIKWEVNTSIAYIVISSVPILLSILVMLLVFKLQADDEIKTVAVIVGAIVIIFSVVAICVQIFDIITCISFPEKAIYNYISGLIGNTTN